MKILFFLNRIDVYDDTNILCKFQKNWIKSLDLIALMRKKLTKIWNDPFSHNAWQIFFIFNKFDLYVESVQFSTELDKKYVDLIA